MITCGTDIIEIERVKGLVESCNENAIYKIFSSNEIEYCESKNKMKYQHYAVRFAAKEAIFKALSTKLNNKFEISWNDVEIVNTEEGRPKVKFLKNQLTDIENIDISLSHCKEFAVAMTVIEWKE